MDIKLGSNNNLEWENGDLKLVDGLEKIQQQVLVALYTLLGDWLLNYLKGIDLPRGLKDLNFLKNDVKKQILGVEGVLQVKNLKVVQQGVEINITATVITIFGGFDLNEGIKQ